MEIDEEARSVLKEFIRSCQCALFENDNAIRSLYQISLNITTLQERFNIK